ncbi:MAG: tetratricopeptide repeat protein [Acidobacteriota bacterium]
MARKLKRKEIKRDQFITLIDRAMAWTGQNWKTASIVLGCAVALGLAYWGVTLLAASRGGAAARALGEAVATFAAPVGGSAAAGEGQRFATNAERLDAAEKAFRRVASRYRFTAPARTARLYLARIAEDRGDVDGAIRLLSELADRRSDNPVVGLATLDLLRLRLAKGEGKQLVKELEAMVAGKDPRLPRDLALFQLARVWEREGNVEEAIRLYRKLTEDFPESPYKFEAQQRLSAAS